MTYSFAEAVGTARRLMTCATAAAVLATAGAPQLWAQDAAPVTIGYAISKSGPNAGGADMTVTPNYELWVEEVNAAGGLRMPDGSQRPIEVIAYDDRSSAEEVVRAVERLATQDEVDFILPPWGTGFNLAVAPLMAKFGYPHLAGAAVTDKASDFVKRWDSSFWFMGGSVDYVAAFTEILVAEREADRINDKIAMISVGDGFGIDLVKAARPSFEAAGFDISYDKTFPPETSDFSTMLSEASNSEADTFVAFSYPPHTFALTKQAKVASYSPPVFYLGVGAGFPVYPGIAGGSVEGVMSLGGIDPDNALNAAYRAKHEEVVGRAPDYWGSVLIYASLQMLAQTIERVGLDKEAVAQELSTGTFSTVLGEETRLENNQLRAINWVGQWQNGQFVAVSAEGGPGTKPVSLPKPAWE
ncbi:amino acid ABC transporter substrate-binding protein [Tritonibacter horizontis]|uniref:Leucine-, isoleucine-, valine-, threonine-, and alanine-binding protein n=1 Tax=Tritonibacter horizontis TaxID=1768241 RepID=A0A132BUR3_9RHOB|nr:amino acid ABC transporter substrate-binding protein [Tritonibacter horizontis]KUP92129.1 leucine-, isoleucine-, valine-, threonine-, and alanine-binding protein precursor [Tritonibacter horizontis]